MDYTSPIIAPSVLAADWSQLATELKRAEAAGADWHHLDVMDGHFVPNISYGPDFVATVAKCSTLPVDVHLMISRPDQYFEQFVESAHMITVHVESEHDVASTLQAIRTSGCKVGLALNPPTPFEAVRPFLDQIDMLLVMTVNPGFGGQSFIGDTMEKVTAAVEARADNGLQYHVEVDGGITGETGKVARGAGADVLVAGTYIYRADDMAGAVASLR